MTGPGLTRGSHHGGNGPDGRYSPQKHLKNLMLFTQFENIFTTKFFFLEIYLFFQNLFLRMASEDFRGGNFSRTPRKLSKDSTGSSFRNRTHSLASSSGSDSGSRPVRNFCYYRQKQKFIFSKISVDTSKATPPNFLISFFKK